MRIRKKEALKGCRIVFSHCFRLNLKAETHDLWKLAEQLGANWTHQSHMWLLNILKHTSPSGHFEKESSW